MRVAKARKGKKKWKLRRKINEKWMGKNGADIRKKAKENKKIIKKIRKERKK